MWIVRMGEGWGARVVGASENATAGVSENDSSKDRLPSGNVLVVGSAYDRDSDAGAYEVACSWAKPWYGVGTGMVMGWGWG